MPNTVSTPSALRHSMMASTALTYPTSFRDRGPSSLAADEHSLGQRLVRSAAAAHLVRERHDVAAFIALAARLVALEAVEEGGDQPEHRQSRADQEPDEERAALDLADHGRGQPEEEHQDEPGHRVA